MKNRIRIILAAMAIAPLSAFAQKSGFNALDYSMQKRHRAADAPFINERLLDNTYIGVTGGWEKIFPHGSYKYKPSINFGINIGKQVWKRTELRLGFNYKTFIDQSNDKITFNGNYNARMNQEMTHLNFNIDHLYNLSSYFWGYNPYRRYEISTVLGAGYTISKEDYDKYHLKNYVFDAHVGLQFKMRTNSPIDITFEPRFTFVNDAIDFSANANWNKFDYSASAMVGITYNFRHKGYVRKDGSRETMGEGLFFDLSTGIVTQTASKYEYSGGKVNATSYGSFATMTPAVNIGVGKWLTPAFGLRLSGERYSVLWHGISFDGYHNTTSYDAVNYKTIYYSHTRFETTSYTGAALEAVIAPIRLFSKKESQIDANIMFGGKIGHMNKRNFITTNTQEIGDNFRGLTSAIRIKAKMSPGMNVFVEPRYNINYYDVTTNYTNVAKNRETHSDKQYAFMMGVELNNNLEKDKTSNSSFRPHPFVSLNGGFNVSLQNVRYSNKNVMDLVYGGAVGYALTPLSSFRINAEEKQVAREIIFDNTQQYQVNKYAMMSVGLNYMLNVGNLICGYNAERKTNLQVYAGPNINLHSKEVKYQVPYLDKDGVEQYEDFTEDANKTSFGYELGSILSYKLTPHIDVNLNIKYQKYNGDVINKDIEKATEEFEKKYRYITSGATKVDRVITYQLGVTYNF